MEETENADPVRDGNSDDIRVFFDEIVEIIPWINPCTNVIYLTAYPDYALDAWRTDACGFIVKPLIPEEVCRQLKKLGFTVSTGGTDE